MISSLFSHEKFAQEYADEMAKIGKFYEVKKIETTTADAIIYHYTLEPIECESYVPFDSYIGDNQADAAKCERLLNNFAVNSGKAVHYEAVKFRERTLFSDIYMIIERQPSTVR